MTSFFKVLFCPYITIPYLSYTNIIPWNHNEQSGVQGKKHNVFSFCEP